MSKSQRDGERVSPGIEGQAGRCPACGSILEAGQPKGFCPQCLLGGALKEGIRSTSLPCAFGDYELIEEIARGGMGVVYKARQKSLNRYVAIKMLLSGAHATDEQLCRFKGEADKAGPLRHPNIVAIHEVGSREGLPYLVMEMVDGPSLSRILRNGPLAPTVAATYVQRVAEAVHFAHSHRILHRDLKPGNILIDSNDQPRVTDFGLAKNLDGDFDLTETGQVCGSPGYMSPEQAGGRRDCVGVTSDVYGLGAILYHSLTGRPPFYAQTVAATLQQVETAEPLAPHLLNSSVPRELETICLKCLQKDPARRYPSAEAVAGELGRFLRGEPIQARPIGRAERLWRWGCRNPLAAAFVGTICVALVTALALIYWINYEKNKATLLAREKQEAIDEKDRANGSLLKMVGEAIEGIWSVKERRSLDVVAEHVAALADLPAKPVTNRASLVRWTMGILTDEYPLGRVRQHAQFLGELEEGVGRRLGYEVRVDLRVYKFHEDLRADLSNGQIHFGRLGARSYFHLRRVCPGVAPLVIPRIKSKQGVMFTRTNSNIRSMADIQAHRFAFGDTNSTVTFWAQIKLAEQGITATNLSGYDFLDATLDFADEVVISGTSNALSHITYLHSHAQVIEGVLNGNYDVGVAVEKYIRIHEYRGLVRIPGSEFYSSRTPLLACPNFDPDFARAIIETITHLEGEWLEKLPDASPGYQKVLPDAYEIEEKWIDRLDALFPPKPPPP